MFGSSCVSSAFSGPQLPSSLQRTKPSEGGGGGGLYGTQFLAKRLRLSRSRPPRRESSHFSGGGGWGAARPCSGGGGSRFFHHSEDAWAGIASCPRRFTASDWPGRIRYTRLSAKEPEAAAHPCRLALGTTALANEVSRQRKPPPPLLPPPTPRESGAREDADTRLPLRRAAVTRSGQPLRGFCQAAPGWCAPPSVAAAPPLHRAALLLRPGPRPPPSKRPSPAAVAALGAGDSGSGV